ncbi:MAG: hypothetical protein DWQ36_14645 [Acidobacteria bacterium]|nr:MAG: hypothetical protein DWQ30_03380 [Acidobacteriota bacterium]REK06130.1 MAG: hypothetical protein DWQ36_14645 [Acidobacteriota bacterium]
MSKKPLEVRESSDGTREASGQRARREERSLAQQGTAELRRSLEVDSTPRRALVARILEELEATGERGLPGGMTPEALVRADRLR